MYCGKTNYKIANLFKESYGETLNKLNVKEAILGMVCFKNETTGFDHEEIEKVIFMKNKIMFVDKKINKSTIQTYWDEYTCISLKVCIF